jgi:hypothetical protein
MSFQKSGVALLCALTVLSLRGYGAEPDWGKELGELKARVHELEGKTEPGNRNMVVHGLLVGNVQAQSIQSSTLESQNVSRGVFVFQPEVSIVPSENDEFFFKFGFAGGKGLGPVSPFVLSPWAGGGENDVEDINGRSRDYLLTSWYKRTLSNAVGRLEVSGGIIDATDYLDENNYANDEFSQFMNTALVNGAHVFAPSYDLGGAFHLEGGPHSLNGVIMNVGENDDGNSYAFYGFQYGAHAKTPMGEGNYRLIYEGSNKKFLDVSEENLKARHGVVLSCDQEIGRVLGGWVRLGVQDQEASVQF